MYVNILKSQVEEEDNIEKGEEEEEARELRRKSEEYGITEIKGRKELQCGELNGSPSKYMPTF